MDEIDKNIPDDFWRKAFDEASEAPPPRVWSAIERQLDESNGPKIIPLWTVGLLASKPLTWGVGLAAAMALLLVGWWAIDSQSMQPSHQQIARQETHQRDTQHVQNGPNKQTLSATATSEPESKALATVEKAETNKSKNSLEQATTVQSVQSEGRSAPRLANRLPKPSTDQLMAQTASRSVASNEQNSTVQRQLSTKTSGSELRRTNAFVQQNDQPAVVSFTTMAPANSLNPSESDQMQRNAIEQLALRPMRLRSPGGIQRIVWFRPAELAVEPEGTKSKHESRQVWASVGMMPGAFNPAVSLRSSQTAAFANAAKTSQPSISSRSNFSIAYQAGAGIQLSDHWSVESGIGYLAARSTVESPNQSASGAALNLMGQMADQASTTGNLYVNAVRNSLNTTTNMAYSNTPKASYDNVATANAYQAYSSQYQQALSSNFEYVQVPLQLGYQIRPRKRLSMAVLGGLLTNIFVRNTIGEDLVVTGKDGVYRPVSWAATMGARFRYRPSRRWSASLAGMYQPTLGETTRPTSQVQSSPTSTGMSFGLDYHF